ncbi:hypothetical protein [Ruficoccus sp. ZRK36]|uniref:hypothetical protein n=1 Tax=Ruficoccus sp. ZRK36 TaxID=2866311 RepID=UPI001C73042B|nr:hypothetical protein [Ruficoccus sp. ZRK36]QYY34905.1 hypothetical protein K0V07_11390 [Ruficoccus sp. ZRK36]
MLKLPAEPTPADTSPQSMAAATQSNATASPVSAAKITQQTVNDVRGNPYERITLDEHGECIRQEHFTYGSSQQLLVWRQLDLPTGQKSRIEYTYSDEGSLRSLEYFSPDNEVRVIEFDVERDANAPVYAGRMIHADGKISAYEGTPFPWGEN